MNALLIFSPYWKPYVANLDMEVLGSCFRRWQFCLCGNLLSMLINHNTTYCYDSIFAAVISVAASFHSALTNAKTWSTDVPTVNTSSPDGHGCKCIPNQVCRNNQPLLPSMISAYFHVLMLRHAVEIIVFLLCL